MKGMPLLINPKYWFTKTLWNQLNLKFMLLT